METETETETKKVVRNIRYIVGPFNEKTERYDSIIHESTHGESHSFTTRKTTPHDLPLMSEYGRVDSTAGSTVRKPPCSLHDGVGLIVYDDGSQLLVVVEGCHTKDEKGKSEMKVTVKRTGDADFLPFEGM